MWRNIMWTLQLPPLKRSLLGPFQVTRMGLFGFCLSPDLWGLQVALSGCISHSWGGVTSL